MDWGIGVLEWGPVSYSATPELRQLLTPVTRLPGREQPQSPNTPISQSPNTPVLQYPSTPIPLRDLRGLRDLRAMLSFSPLTLATDFLLCL
jgi:hypothetical protein